MMETHSGDRSVWPSTNRVRCSWQTTSETSCGASPAPRLLREHARVALASEEITLSRAAALELHDVHLIGVQLGEHLVVDARAAYAARERRGEAQPIQLARPPHAAGYERRAGARCIGNAYARAASLPIGSSDVTPYHAIGVLERLGTLLEPLPKMACPSAAEWTRAEYDAALVAVQDFAAKIAEIGVPAKHPFDGCGLVELMPGDLEKIEATLKAATAAGKAVRAAGGALARALGIADPTDLAALETINAVAVLALEAPNLRGIPPVGPAWDWAESVKALAEAGQRAIHRRSIMTTHASKLIAPAWDADVLSARGDLLADGGAWWKRLFSGRYKAAKR